MMTDIPRFCAAEELICPGETVLCCVSGGADSMALLHWFFFHREELGLAGVCCVHLNHGIRGAESDADEDFVTGFCQSCGIPLYKERARLSGTEEEARQARYELFERAADAFGADRIATGHTLNDNAETVLFRLARGTGLRGAAGIPVRRGRFIRPLLCVTREETEAYCRENGIAYREDSTNAADSYARNRVRHHALPALSTVSPRAVQAIADFARTAGEAASYLERQAGALREAAKRDRGWDRQLLRDADPALRHTALRQMMEEQGLEPDRTSVLSMDRILREEGRTQLETGLLFAARKDRCFFDETDGFLEEEALLEGKELTLPSGRGIVLTPVVYEDIIRRKLTKDVFHSCLSYDKVIGNVRLRHRRPGDVFCSARRKCTKPVKEILSEKGLTNIEKRNVLLLEDAGGIIWMEGEGTCPRVRPDRDGGDLYSIHVNEKEKNSHDEG